jgi:hypothetical protein
MWTDFLCGHENAAETNESIAEIGARFKPAPGESPFPFNRLRGEESTLFLGVAPNGSPAFIHHITDLGSTHTTPEPELVGLMGLHKSTTIIAIDHSECFGAIEWEDEPELSVSSFVKLKSPLRSSIPSPSGKSPMRMETL